METFKLLAGLDEEQRAFHEVLRSVASQLEDGDRAGGAQGGPDRSAGTWDSLTRLGVSGLMVPESLSGSGAGLVELAVTMEIAGRHLLSAPVLSTVALATSVLADGAPEVADDPLRSIAAGATATVAITDGSIPTAARLVDGRWQLTGSKTNVIDGYTATIIVVVAEADGAPALLVLDTDDSRARRTPQNTLDLTRQLARLDLDGARATMLARGETARAALRTMESTACIALGAEQLGVSERLLDMTVDYASTRAQFGRAIGSFQAVKHHCANMLIEVELLAAAVENAIRVTDDADLPLAAALVQAHASEACVQIANVALQVHGGIGFTWEHPLHLFLKRARSSRQLFGTALHHRSEVARLVGLT